MYSTSLLLMHALCNRVPIPNMCSANFWFYTLYMICNFTTLHKHANTTLYDALMLESSS